MSDATHVAKLML